MARLQAAKRIGVDEEEEGEQGEAPSAAAAPPPLPASTAAPLVPGPAAPASKPAHLLVAELDEEDARARRPLPRPTSSVEQIAALEIARPIPEAKPKRRLPTSVTIGIVVVVAGLAIGAALFKANKEPPPPKQEIDPALVAKMQRRQQAVDALEDGHVLLRQRKTDEAIASYKKALELEPSLAKAERGLGIAFAAKGDKKEAVSRYRRYLQLDPSAPDADDVKKIIEKFGKETP